MLGWLQTKRVVALIFLVSALPLTAGCAHTSPARCDRRPPSPEQPPAGARMEERDWYARRQKVLETVRKLYTGGMSEIKTRADRGASSFCSVYDYLTYDQGGGEFLYEQLEDGRWSYRCDEMTRLFTLANYRCAVLRVERGDADPQWDRGIFCSALGVRPEVVLETGKREQLSPEARRFFELSLHYCYDLEGWRERDPSPKGQGRPVNSPPLP